jgi:hypothetical protein
VLRYPVVTPDRQSSVRQVRILASVTMALLAAAAAPALVFGAMIHSLGGVAIAFVIALPHAVVLGLPLFALMLAKRRVSALSSLIGGFVVGVTPKALMSSPAVFHPDADWRSLLMALLLLGVCGAIGGLAFFGLWKVFGEAVWRGGTRQGA